MKDGHKFNEVLAQLMYDNNLNIPQTAKKVGIGNRSIDNWFWHGGIPNMSSLVKIANYFDVTIDYLVYGEREAGLSIRELERLDAQINKLAVAIVDTQLELEKIKKQYNRRIIKNDRRRKKSQEKCVHEEVQRRT